MKIENLKLKISARQAGFSVIEVLLAAALFVIFSSGIIFVMLQGLDANRTGSEETIANQYAAEGMEATRSIKNQSFANMADSAGTGVVASSSGVWKFSGSNNVLSSKYTRVITVSDVQRDGSSNIVASGGTLDPDTKKITSTVSWNASPTRNDSVVLTSYFTNWRDQTVVSTTCAQYCTTVSNFTTGECLQNSGKCAGNGETYEAGGDAYCPHNGTQNVCCCQ